MLLSRKKDNLDEHLQDYTMRDGFSWAAIQNDKEHVAAHPVFHFVSHQLQKLTNG